MKLQKAGNISWQHWEGNVIFNPANMDEFGKG